MKKKIRGLLNHKAIIIGLNLLLALSFAANAQNASYDYDYIPIPGTGTTNCAFGFQSLFSNTTGNYNAGFGLGSLKANTTGEYNTGIGFHALHKNTIGAANTAIGNNSLSNNTTGQDNTATGGISLLVNQEGSFNAAYGNGSLLFNNGSFNTANGYLALYSNFTGTYNTALGYYANVGANNLTNATAIGNGATVKYSNTMQLGNNELTAVYVGTGTTATLVTGGLQVTGGSLVPGYVLTSNSSGVATWQPPSGGGGADWTLTGNLSTVDGTNFIGTRDNVPFNIRVNNLTAGRLDPFYQNTFYGIESGGNWGSSVGAYYNTAVGFHSLKANTDGFSNVAVGWNALLNNTTGWANTAVGVGALNKNTTKDANSAFGLAALFENISGRYNTGLGANALAENVSGSDNTGCGESALFNNSSGSYNTACGESALENNTTGSSNTALGYFADVNNSAYQNSTVIGAGAMVNASNKVRIGDLNVTVIEGNVAFSPPSDGRFKTNISESDIRGLEFINRLRPVVFNFDNRKFEEFLTKGMPDSVRKIRLSKDFSASTAIRRSGFIAQEVEKAANEVGYNFDAINKPANDDDNYSLAYSQFVVPLVKSVQELSKQNEDLKKEIDELRSMIKNISTENKEGSIKITGSNPDARLFQNAPNPFNRSTIIRYSIPADAKKAIIVITSLDGIKVSEFSLINNKGQGIEITGGSLSAGTYIYSLFVDDKLIDSKKMILSR